MSPSTVLTGAIRLRVALHSAVPVLLRLGRPTGRGRDALARQFNAIAASGVMPIS
jgi:hypothetical protein